MPRERRLMRLKVKVPGKQARPHTDRHESDEIGGRYKEENRKGKSVDNEPGSKAAKEKNSTMG